MTFSPEWNTAYANGQRRQSGMSAMLVHMFATTIGNFAGQRVLELGCGVGSNAKDLIGAGAEYCGLDGSAPAIAEAAEANPTGHFSTCDFTHCNPLGWNHDIVFDRAGVSHNDTGGVERAIDNAWSALKPGGIYIGCDWFSTNHSEYARGEIVDLRTRRDYPDGQFVAVGNVHFTDEREIHSLFNAFERISLSERVTRHMHRQNVPWRSSAFDGVEYRSAVFDFAFRKPR